jgi:tetratricopeptide (TPR) repeat protein
MTGRRLDSRDWRLIAVLLLVAVAGRVFYSVDYADSPLYHEPIIDAGYHSLLARQLIEGVRPGPGAYFKPPLYAWVLADLYGLAGGKAPGAAHLFNSLCGLAAVLLTYLLARRLTGRRAAFGAALFVALYDLGPFFEEQVLATSLVTVLYLATLLLYVRAWEDGLSWERRRERLVWAGVVMGLATLARPNLLLFWPVVGVLGFLFARRDLGFNRSRTAFAVLAPLGIALAVVLPATLRNLVHAGEFVLVSANGGINFYIGNGPGADGYSAVPPGLAWDRLAASAATATEGPALADSSLWYSRALGHLLNSPGDALGLLAKKLLLVFNGADISNNVDLTWVRQQSLWLRFNPLRWWLAAPLGLAGLAMLLGRGRRLLTERRRTPGRIRALTLLGAFTIAYIVGVVLFFVCSRYRLPLVPPAAILGALFVAYLLRLIGERNRRRLPGALVALLAAVGIGLLPLVRPTDGFWGHFHAAGALERRNDYGGALTQIEQALELRPADPEALKSRAEINLELGRLETAREDLLAAVEAAPDYSGAWYLLGRTTPHPERRRGYLERAVETDPAAVQPRMELAILLMQRGEAHTAAAVLERVLELRPRFAAAHRMLGDNYLALGRRREAALEYFIAEFYHRRGRAAVASR